ncbi:MAG: NTP transferase domain-containing protein [Planctomycetota bacterium]
MSCAAIVTAKGGNQTLSNKNVVPVLGVPVMAYPIRAAKMAHSIDHVYVSTEDELITSIAEGEGATLIDRPAELSEPTSQHRDVIKHAVEHVKALDPELEFVVVLLGNTVMVTPGMIDRCVKRMQAGGCDSCLTVWKAQDDHPYRALSVSEDGYVESMMNASSNSNRQSYPTAYFYDQGVWAFRWECAIEQKGPAPWVWLGEQCVAIERPWVTGRDIHSWIDVAASVWYLNAIQAYDFQDYEEV